MPGRVIEIAGDRRHLALYRGFMKIESDGTEIGRVALDDLLAVVVTGQGISYSNNLLVEITGRGIALVFTGNNYRPVGWIWPIDGHFTQAGRMQAQLSLSGPMKKRLWQGIVQAKIIAQGQVLDDAGLQGHALLAMAGRVKSGDHENIEAQAARRYWPTLFGDDFLRDHDGHGINALLNYGYAILRATAARAIAGAGLHPSLGLHHHNKGNAFCLVDDLMEPFRPIIDRAVHDIVRTDPDDVTIGPDQKKILAELMSRDLPTGRGRTPIFTCVERLATSIALAAETGRPGLDMPHGWLLLPYRREMDEPEREK